MKARTPGRVAATTTEPREPDSHLAGRRVVLVDLAAMASPGPPVIRRTFGVYVTIALMSFMELVGVSGLIVGGDTVIFVMSALFVVFASFFVYRALRLELRAEEEGLYLRGALGTRFYEWGELRGADIVPGSIFFRTWYLRVFREGRRPLRLPDLSEFALAPKVDALAISEMARHIERRVRAAGGRPIE